ncbi:hypothetical protein [Mycobacterium sp. 852002-51961_SCH5331710]|jgi:hypothetical protein|uniref:hypothetical protein n=1 Tax=Mycobacterium sp. 852002-51961_SCH5331710 TaxID=1834105 RepID=UPI0007FCE19C|nr:hypothetical protein [Mycobacterium sp. 852002-51961_SCH5331710]OBB44293.1 hypothetical protein A5752_03925 [Mycobacterium sp. 852002-51961_SCH5331710]
MRRTPIAAVAGGLAAALIGLAAPVAAAPTGPSNAQDTINQLRSEGYTVIVTQVGTAPLSEAQVVAVRKGPSHTKIDAGSPVIGSSHNYTTYEERTVYVDVK